MTSILIQDTTSKKEEKEEIKINKKRKKEKEGLEEGLCVRNTWDALESRENRGGP